MTLRVGNLKAEKGQKKTGYLQVGETSLSKVAMPVTVINGVEPGPTLAMTAGFHPREYASIESLTRLSNRIDPATIRGSAIIVHIVNTPGFEVRGEMTLGGRGLAPNRLVWSSIGLDDWVSTDGASGPSGL